MSSSQSQPAPPTAGKATADSAAAATYRARLGTYGKLAEELGGRSRRVSNLRGLAFGTAVVAGGFWISGGHPQAGMVAVVALAAFIALVILHARVVAAEDDALRFARVNLDALARCTDRFQELADDGARFTSEGHPYTGDLDVFGPGSIYQRINVGHTRFGQEALATFLSAPADPATIRLRQEAASALAPKLEERQRLETLSIAVVEPPPGTGDAPRGRKPTPRHEAPDPEPLLSWAEGEPQLSKRRALVVVAHILPLATIGLFVAARAGGLPNIAWVVPLLVQIALVVSTNAEAERVFSAVSSTRGAFLRYGPMFSLIEGADLGSTLLGKVRGAFLSGKVRPSDAMRKFERVVGWFDLRHNGLIHPFANAFALWDVHCVLRLEAWQRLAGRDARAWFQALGEVEALSAFAGFSYDEPGFAWPEIVEGPAIYHAEGLVHPLLPPEHRVANDVVALEEPGRALLITGSNMSGKSTLLRAMGATAALALAGAPVSARRLRLSPVAIRSSMRISDSLRRGVSHFYAEVSRLRDVLDGTAGELPVFFLLDEILHGTNSDERQIGARWILAELVRRGAIGAVSTHDVGLHQLPDYLMSHIAQFHFRESVENGKMTFDYRLRAGPVSGGNALRLMRLVGLPIPLAPGESS
ncbi:MAG TPA: DNA mismatch repair protein MutS [Polyangiaceae bacterium]|nr:DNA mismatch repair protein MutS [Polyangiaceae bacterium]